MPAELALEAAALLESYGLLDIVDLLELADREREPRDPFEVARLYPAMSEHLGISLALTAVSGLERGDRWHSLARLALRDDLYSSLQRRHWTRCAKRRPGLPWSGRSPSGTGERLAAAACPAGAGPDPGRAYGWTSRPCRWCRGSCAAWRGNRSGRDASPRPLPGPTAVPRTPCGRSR